MVKQFHMKILEIGRYERGEMVISGDPLYLRNAAIVIFPTDADCQAAAGLLLQDVRAELTPLPTPPAPKIRPYTPVEAAAHLGRSCNCGRRNKVVQVDAIEVECIRSFQNFLYSYKDFAKECTWADDNSPCGIIECPTP